MTPKRQPYLRPPLLAPDWPDSTRKHLTVTSRGKALIVVAHDGPDDPLVRLERLGPDEYGLSIRWHDDRWQRLPVAGTLDKLVAVLRADYSSLLAAV